MGNKMGMELKLGLMEEHMLGNGRMDLQVDKGLTLYLMDKSMLGNGRIGICGME